MLGAQTVSRPGFHLGRREPEAAQAPGGPRQERSTALGDPVAPLPHTFPERGPVPRISPRSGPRAVRSAFVEQVHHLPRVPDPGATAPTIGGPPTLGSPCHLHVTSDSAPEAPTWPWHRLPCLHPTPIPQEETSPLGGLALTCHRRIRWPCRGGHHSQLGLNAGLDIGGVPWGLSGGNQSPRACGRPEVIPHPSCGVCRSDSPSAGPPCPAAWSHWWPSLGGLRRDGPPPWSPSARGHLRGLYKPETAAGRLPTTPSAWTSVSGRPPPTAPVSVVTDRVAGPTGRAPPFSILHPGDPRSSPT